MTYTCSMCGNTYESDWTDEEAVAQKDAVFGDVPRDDCDIVCDDCYQELVPHALRAATPAPRDHQ